MILIFFSIYNKYECILNFGSKTWFVYASILKINF